MKNLAYLFLIFYLLKICEASTGGDLELIKNDKSQAQSLQERVQQIVQLTQKRGFVLLDNKTFKELVRGSPRNYSVVVMFTALSTSRGCLICRQANEEFSQLINSFRHAQTMMTNRLFFGVVDFDDGVEIFQSIGINSAPAFVHFPPKGKPKKRDHMDIQRLGFVAEVLAKWIAERTDMYIRVYRGPNYFGTMVLITCFGVAGVLIYLRRNNLEFLFNPNTWCSFAILFVLFMISGQMWNHIRGPPFVYYTQSGGVAYVHDSSQGQFVSETYFVMIMYGLVVLGVILLCEAGSVSEDKINGPGPGLRRIQAFFGLGLLIFFFSLILSMFRSKAGGYPYRFLFR
jgi:oligosaccharyltransferase complex subunit gamma